MRTALTAIIAAAAAVAAMPQARAGAPDPKRSVALLEFRSGSAALPGVADRAARILEDKTSLDVVGNDAARRRYDDHLDRDVVRCSGEPACIAEIGRRLSVDEVLLIGVSEFGDVIVTLQRIDTSRKEVVGRIAEAMAPGSTPDDAQLAGYVERLMPESDFVRWGIIRIDANVDEAAVRIGSEDRGRTPIDPLRVRAPASYDIELSKPGYIDFRASVDVPPDAIVKVRPTLSRKDDAWYEHWWVAAVAGTVVVGAVTAGVMATRGSPDDVPIGVPPF